MTEDDLIAALGYKLMNLGRTYIASPRLRHMACEGIPSKIRLE
jgi:hypothetical protein